MKNLYTIVIVALIIATILIFIVFFQNLRKVPPVTGMSTTYNGGYRVSNKKKLKRKKKIVNIA